MDKIVLGLRIRELREKKNLTQVEFAEMIDITDKALSKIEVGRSYPHLNTFMAMSEELGVSLDFLASDNDEYDGRVEHLGRFKLNTLVA